MKKKCSLILNVSDSCEPKTVVVLGTPAGGTSSVAGLLQKLGVFMGEDVDPNNHEDRFLQGQRGDSLNKRVMQRNREHGLWGWKDPVAIDMVDNFAGNLRNPHFVIVFRDMFATASSELFRRYREREEHLHYLEVVQSQPLVEPSVVSEFHQQMSAAFERQQRLYAFVTRSTYPMLLVSYERLLSAPLEFAVDAANFLQIDVNEDCLNQAAASIDLNWKEKVSRKRG